ncbi:expressed unknown protein [Seminavis robusta]|uniref:Sulfotransferase n=1 Tax=Seminavis robusta TaxID=568900 RepID=A0A9N8HH99_9STRA|nr:expressed unknown protein [Seminavis robusta]|eukprot:Sro693_g188220.1 n/a (302) ;mRNA; f:9377-10385
MSENATNQTKSPGKFVMQHVWKTGGTELCRLARANGWKVPETPGCTIFIHPHQGWPEEDYDMYGNEGAIPSGIVDNEFFPRNEFATRNHNWKTAHGVKWITTLRHPYARTLSHYNHVKLQAKFQNLTFEEFLVERGGGFEHFIDNQQTRWHCGTGHCANTKFQVNEEKLSHAISNLDKMSAVLLLEGMKDPTSCTRRQMRHVLQFKNETLDGQAEPDLTPKTRHSSKTDWEQVVRPFLDNRGISTNSSVNGFNTSVIMSALGFHNSYDMQLYGYARHLCEVLADQYDQEANTNAITNQLNR